MKKNVWVPAPLDLLVWCSEKSFKHILPNGGGFYGDLPWQNPVKNNKSNLLIFFGTMCNSRPPELYSEFSGGNGTKPIDEI